MMNKPAQKSQRTHKLRGKLILGRTQSDDKGCVYHCANRMLKQVETFSVKRKNEMCLLNTNVPETPIF